MKPVIVIPAYQPDRELITLAEALCKTGAMLIIVNDGSSPVFASIFEELQHRPNITVLKHAINLGKGQALKTAFHYFLNHFSSEIPGVVTADADGQHRVHDILRLADALFSQPHTLSLGARTFTKTTPWKSRMGNQLTCTVFRLLIGKKLQDTQTGLRAIPRELLPMLLKTPSAGYEFELDMLILASTRLSIREISIDTVYTNNNAGSHFNPLVDSLKIYFIFFRFILFSIMSGLLDFFAFSFAFVITGNLLLSESLARLFSGTCNFLFNKSLVFKSQKKILPEAIKYSMLCVANLGLSYTLIQSLIYLGCNVFAGKIIALIGLFIANFAIQQLLVFNQKENTTYAH